MIGVGNIMVTHGPLHDTLFIIVFALCLQTLTAVPTISRVASMLFVLTVCASALMGTNQPTTAIVDSHVEVGKLIFTYLLVFHGIVHTDDFVW